MLVPQEEQDSTAVRNGESMTSWLHHSPSLFSATTRLSDLVGLLPVAILSEHLQPSCRFRGWCLLPDAAHFATAPVSLCDLGPLVA